MLWLKKRKVPATFLSVSLSLCIAIIELYKRVLGRMVSIVSSSYRVRKESRDQQMLKGLQSDVVHRHRRKEEKESYLCGIE